MRVFNKKKFEVICFLLISAYIILAFNRKYLKMFKILGSANLDQKLSEAEGIFFIKSIVNGTDSEAKYLSPREYCSIESAALMNPDRNIFVVFATNEDNNRVPETNLTHVLKSYKNVNAIPINYVSFSKDTPGESWMASDKIAISHFALNNLSNYLRLLLLWKYGGVYLDLDVISLRSVDQISDKNFVCAESESGVNNAVIRFDDRENHKALDAVLEMFMKNYNGNIWGHNGPDLITNLIKENCNEKNFEKKFSCMDLTILPKEHCYAINWIEQDRFFHEEFINATMLQIENSTFVHLWHKLNHARVFRADSNIVYTILAKKYCPKVFESVTVFT